MSISFANLIIILFIIFIVFGAGKLPKVMEDLGKGLRGFKTGLNEAEKDAKEHEKMLIAQNDKEEKVK